MARLAGRGGDHRTAIALLTSAVATHGVVLEDTGGCHSYVTPSHPAAQDALRTLSSTGTSSESVCDDTRVQLARLFRHRALHQLQLLNYDECLADCRLAIRLFAGDPETHVVAALAHFHLRQFDDAVASLSLYVARAVALATVSH